MTWRRIAFAVTLAYLWAMMIVLGSVVLETFMIYPNIFYNPPESFAAGLEFMAIRAPNDFFPPLGLATWLTGGAALILAWPVKAARYWVLGSLAMIVLEGLFSMAFFWPRNEIMFIEGTAVHSADFLRQTAEEFQRLHWSRLAFNALGAAMIFVGFLKLHRERILAGLSFKPAT